MVAFFDPRDQAARHRLIVGLVQVRLDDAARREFTALERVDPTWRRDAALVAAIRMLDWRSKPGADVTEL